MRAEYRVEYGIFGKMGVARATLDHNATRYKIAIEARATGLAKLLSGGRVERYESEGRIVGGRFVPDRFAKDIRRSGKRRIKIYLFDHLHRHVTFDEKRFKHGKLTDRKHETLPYYAKDDILSLYFNIRAIIGDCDKPFDEMLHAVGAEKKTGKVRVRTLVGAAHREALSLLGQAPCYLKVTIYQKLFGSKGGELYLAMDERGVVHKAVLKDVVMFGDVRGVLKKLEMGSGDRR